MKIYVATHKNFDTSILPEDYIPLQVGKEGKESLGFICDNDGLNISNRNSQYCELTGLYWIWKNSKEDIVGLCHYRRYFTSFFSYFIKVLTGFNSGILKGKTIKRILKKNDIIVYPFKVKKSQNIYQCYSKGHYESDMKAIEDAIQKLYPEYLNSFYEIMNGREFYYANMFIAHKKIINDYSKWLFDVLFEAEKKIDTSEYDSYQKRVMGFISERIFKVWVKKNNLRICKRPVIMVEDCSIFRWIFNQLFPKK